MTMQNYTIYEGAAGLGAPFLQLNPTLVARLASSGQTRDLAGGSSDTTTYLMVGGGLLLFLGVVYAVTKK